MNKTLQRHFIFFCLLSAIAYWVQTNLFLHKDVAVILHTAKQLLQGQTYTHDIFEPNPPLIFYLHALPILLTKMYHIPLLHSFRSYVLFLTSLSMLCSYQLLKTSCKVWPRTIEFMFGTLAYVLLWLPADNFGQREHFYVILTVPYLLLAVCRLQAKYVHPLIALLIGMFAGVGFAIKPFFLPSLCFIELLFVYQKNSILGWIRLESAVCIVTIVTYGLTVIWLYPDYVHIVLPFWMPYYHGITKPWPHNLLNSCFIWCCVMLGLHVGQKTQQMPY